MDFPSIKLNILKKLEYFSEIKKLNERFDIQYKILIKQKWNNSKQEFTKDDNNPCAYPSWEIEKKILYWTYAYHKHLGRPIRMGHLNDMFITENEYKRIKLEKIFENLEMYEFGRKIKVKDGEIGFLINIKGLAFGELLWYLYKNKKYTSQNNIPPTNYIDVFQTSHKLTRCSFGVFILYLQLISFCLFTIFAGVFFILEILEKVGLLDDIRNIAINIFYQPSSVLIHLFLLPLFLFILSLILDFIYRFIKNKRL